MNLSKTRSNLIVITTPADWLGPISIHWTIQHNLPFIDWIADQFNDERWQLCHVTNERLSKTEKSRPLYIYTSLIWLVGNCFTCWALWLWNFFSFHFVFPFLNCLRVCVCLTWLYDNMMETTRSEREKKFCPGSARGGRGFHVCVRVSLLEAEPAEIVEPGAPFEKWKRFCHFSFFLLFNCSPLTTIVPFSQCSAVVLSACVFSSLFTNLRILPTNRDRDHQETGGNWSELRSYPAKLYYQIDEINHQQKKDKGRRLIMRNVFLPPKKNNPSLPEYNEWKNIVLLP